MGNKRFMNRVEHWDDERDCGNGIIVTLHYGWSFEPNTHEGVKGFDTKKEAIGAIRASWACNCAECHPVSNHGGPPPNAAPCHIGG